MCRAFFIGFGAIQSDFKFIVVSRAAETPVSNPCFNATPKCDSHWNLSNSKISIDECGTPDNT